MVSPGRVWNTMEITTKNRHPKSGLATAVVVVVIVAVMVVVTVSPGWAAKPKALPDKPAAKAAKAEPASDLDRCMGWIDVGNRKIDQQEPQAATVEFTKALALCPNVCAAMIGMGLSAYTLGGKLEALGWLEKAAACNPENVDLKNVLAGLRKELAPPPAPRPPVAGDVHTMPPGQPAPAMPTESPLDVYDGFYVGKECDIQGCSPLKVTIRGQTVEGATYDSQNKPVITITGKLDPRTGELHTSYTGTLKIMGFSFELRGDCTGRVIDNRAEGKCKGSDAFGVGSTFRVDRRALRE